MNAPDTSTTKTRRILASEEPQLFDIALELNVKDKFEGGTVIKKRVSFGFSSSVELTILYADKRFEAVPEAPKPRRPGLMRGTASATKVTALQLEAEKKAQG